MHCVAHSCVGLLFAAEQVEYSGVSQRFHYKLPAAVASNDGKLKLKLIRWIFSVVCHFRLRSKENWQMMFWNKETPSSITFQGNLFFFCFMFVFGCKYSSNKKFKELRIGRMSNERIGQRTFTKYAGVIFAKILKLK